MLLTVFTSTLNRAGLLPRIFESIVRQKRTDIEWLVVDDGSEDDTPEIIAEFARQASCIQYGPASRPRRADADS